MDKKAMLRNEEKFRVRYLGGHSLYPEEAEGILYVTADNVRFESSKLTGCKVKFGFPMKKLKQAKIRNTKRSYWARAWALGPLTLFFPERYVQIIYEEKDGTVQVVDFDFVDDGKDIRKNFFLKLLSPALGGNAKK